MHAGQAKQAVSLDGGERIVVMSVLSDD